LILWIWLIFIPALDSWNCRKQAANVGFDDKQRTILDLPDSDFCAEECRLDGVCEYFMWDFTAVTHDCILGNPITSTLGIQEGKFTNVVTFDCSRRVDGDISLKRSEIKYDVNSRTFRTTKEEISPGVSVGVTLGSLFLAGVSYWLMRKEEGPLIMKDGAQ